MQNLPLLKNPEGVFVFIDDDEDEHELFKLAIKAIGLTNKIISHHNGLEALEYLKKAPDRIFMIVCDINMPKMDGLELKRSMELIPEIKIKAIPFFYHSSTASEAEIKAAYSLNIQGFLQKALSLDITKQNFTCIFNLWTNCVHPLELS